MIENWGFCNSTGVKRIIGFKAGLFNCRVAAYLNYGIIALAIFTLILGHWFRALRHRYLLDPLKRIETFSLFSALMIGYMANAILPAHLGEILRAYTIGKKGRVSGSSVFATIVVERVVDVLTLLLLMGVTFLVYPFPQMLRLSAYLTFAFTVGIVGVLIFLKLKPHPTLRLIEIFSKPLPDKMGNMLTNMASSFREGMIALKGLRSYVIFSILSIIIPGCYMCVLAIGFYALNFFALYGLPIGATLVVLIMTAIAVLVPSSPGYIGTYHWLCMVALSIFGVPESSALGYAIIIHAVNVIPVALIGVVFAFREGLSISKIEKQGGFMKIAVS